jgi:3-oxoacyl-[acyl-carrier-protein] synthase-3
MLTANYLPQTILSNDSFDELGWSSKKIYSKTGIQERRITAENETALDLAEQACGNLFANFSIDTTAIDYLIYCTQSPDFVVPNNASLLHHKLNLNSNCASLDINQGCTGFLYGLSLAKGLLQSGQASKVLLVTTDTYTKYIHETDRTNRTIFGDGATATLLDIDDANSLGNFVFGTNGEGAFNLCVESFGLKNKHIQNNVNESSDAYEKKDYLYMNGAEIFSFTLDKVPQCVESVLLKNKLEKNEVDFFIFHQANAYMLEHLREKLDLPKEKFVIDLEYSGNTVSSTIPIVLSHLQEKNQLFKGAKVLFVAFGVGYSWIATTYIVN